MAKTRTHKGRSLLAFPRDYTVLDIETTGMTPEGSEIIEISAIRFRGFERAESFSSLIKPRHRISRFITYLTGITNDMVKGAPDISYVIEQFESFIGSDILMGYNVNFDINFLYDYLQACHGRWLENDFVDVLRFARKALPYLPDRKQTSVAEYYGISTKGAHRALTDCIICNSIYRELMKEAVFEELWQKEINDL